ncbi:MAG TPA: alpha/beta hydrolase [Terriglobales bacterium]
MKFHKVTGGGGTQLNVVESGNPKGRPILYIHGLSQCWMQWSRQLNSDLAQDHRLIAMDMRGHGLSDKPLEGYAGSNLWADDVNAVIETLELDGPVLCGWSYGPLVILDYIRHYGEERVGGLHFVGSVTKLGSEDALAALTPAFLGLVPGFFSSDVNESVKSLQGLLRLCLSHEPAIEEVYLMLGYNISVPPYVRQALLSRSINNDDILPTIRKPVLITHGAQDAIVKPSVVNLHKAAMPHAQIHMMDKVGHACFWDDAASFNHRQRDFAKSLGQATRAQAS